LLNPDNLEETGSISCYTNKAAVKELNELEYINGKIYANVWMKNVIIIIDPRTGAVEGVADMNRLVKEMANTQHLGHDDVLNGIAYDAENDRLFVTGKYWGELFEIELMERK
jgi:glutaminyl-peptide cyclotransferase